MVGLWLGAITEHEALAEILARADLTDDCKKQIDEAIHGVIQDYEGTPETPTE